LGSEQKLKRPPSAVHLRGRLDPAVLGYAANLPKVAPFKVVVVAVRQQIRGAYLRVHFQ